MTHVQGMVRPDGTDLETGKIDCFSKSKNVAVIERHRKLFAVPSSEEMNVFLDLVKRSEGCSVEASCKVEGDERHSARFNLFFHTNPSLGYIAVRSFLETLGRITRLDVRCLDEFVGVGFDFSRVEKVIAGIDLRATTEDSRAKIWFMLNDDPERVERALTMQGDDGPARSLILHSQFLVGFDLHLHGQSHVKLYPDIRPAELEDPRVKQAFSARVLSVMEQCGWTHVYFPRPGQPCVLQFHPRQPDRFIGRFLASDLAEPIHRQYAGQDLLDMVVSFREDRVGFEPVREFALYYMPREAV